MPSVNSSKSRASASGAGLLEREIIQVRQGLTKEGREDEEKKKISTHTFLLLNRLLIKPKSGSGSRLNNSESYSQLIVELASLTLSSETWQNEINRQL